MGRTPASRVGRAAGLHRPKKPASRLSALVLAAGRSSRFRGTKQLEEVGGKALIEMVLDAIPAEVGETVVVLGHDARRVARAIGPREGVRVVVNEDYSEGMASSIRKGVSALAEDSEGVMLLLADQPFVTRSLLRRMLGAFGARKASGVIVAAARERLVAPPVVLSRRYFRELAELQGDQGARSVIERHARSLVRVRAGSKAALSDIDTRDDLAAARRLLQP